MIKSNQWNPPPIVDNDYLVTDLTVNQLYKIIYKAIEEVLKKTPE